jgi:hypothetical protein
MSILIFMRLYFHDFFFYTDEYYTNPDGTTTTHRSVSRQEINSNVDQKIFAKNKKDDCQIFIVIGSILGCLIIAASLLMCILSARLMKLTREYKKEKLEGVVREHRMKFGNQHNGPVMGGKISEDFLSLISSSQHVFTNFPNTNLKLFHQ